MYTIKETDYYIVQSNGVIVSKRTGRPLKYILDKRTYRLLLWWYEGVATKRCRKVCDVIAEYHLPNPRPDIYTEVFHKDGDPLNNDISNLQWYRGLRKSLLVHDLRRKRVEDKTEAFIEYCYQNPRSSMKKIAEEFYISVDKVEDLGDQLGVEVRKYRKPKGVIGAKEIQRIQYLYYIEGMTQERIGWFMTRSRDFVGKILRWETYPRYTKTREQLIEWRKKIEVKHGKKLPKARL